mgnify:CR=1 FL=1
MIAAANPDVQVTLLDSTGKKLKAVENMAEEMGVKLMLPVDTVCAKEFNNDAESATYFVDEIPEGPAIIATGPLTDPALCDAISRRTGVKALNFFDAAAPIVTLESLNMERVFRQSRYGRGDDYLNCPMNREE